MSIMYQSAETWSKINSPRFCSVGTFFSPLLYHKFRLNRVRDAQYIVFQRKFSYFVNVPNSIPTADQGPEWWRSWRPCKMAQSGHAEGIHRTHHWIVIWNSFTMNAAKLWKKPREICLRLSPW